MSRQHRPRGARSKRIQSTLSAQVIARIAALVDRRGGPRAQTLRAIIDAGLGEEEGRHGIASGRSREADS
jgi:hypothetical protein